MALPFIHMGKWKMGYFDPRLVLFFGILIAIEAVARGIDYLTGDHPDTTSSLTAIEKAMPLQWWGALCLFAGAGVLIGMLGRWATMIIGCSMIGGATYLTLAVGLAMKAWERDGDGFRTPVMFVVVGIVWFCIAWGTAEKMRRLALMEVLSASVTPKE